MTELTPREILDAISRALEKAAEQFTGGIHPKLTASLQSDRPVSHEIAALRRDERYSIEKAVSVLKRGNGPPQDREPEPHVDSSFERALDEVGAREQAAAAALKSAIVRQIAQEMKKQQITKARMSELMQTDLTQVDRLLDPDDTNVTLEMLIRAADIVGRELRLQLA